jgi:hypothetical protein
MTLLRRLGLARGNVLHENAQTLKNLRTELFMGKNKF